jgi:transposase-like protein
MNGRLHYLWRAVDQDRDVLDILVQRHRYKKAAKKFFRKLLKGLRYVRRVIVTDNTRIIVGRVFRERTNLNCTSLNQLIVSPDHRSRPLQ